MILGIDLGQKTTGLAISEGQLATPYKTITHKSQKEALSKILEICETESIEKIVLGYVPGKIRKLFENFAKEFKKARSAIEVVMIDETLTTRQATETMIKLQLSRKNRQKKEHEMAASQILQSYLNQRD